MAKVKYTSRVISSTKNEIKKEILVSMESTPEIRKEIARVFQQANRRIQNIEKAGYLSPALESLNFDKNAGYSKFNFSGKDWNEIKFEYAKAVSFLQKPTSTASGAKQYEQHLQKAYELNKFEFDAIKHNLQKKVLSKAESAFIEKIGFRYSDYSGEFQREVRDVSDQIESDAKNLKNMADFDNALDKDLQKIFPEIAQNEIERILKGFKDFEL